MCLGNPPASQCWLLLSSCSGVGNGSDSWLCLTFLMHWCMEVTAPVVHIAATKFLRARGKLESKRSHPDLLVSIGAAVSASQHPLYVHRSKLQGLCNRVWPPWFTEVTLGAKSSFGISTSQHGSEPWHHSYEFSSTSLGPDGGAQ